MDYKKPGSENAPLTSTCFLPNFMKPDPENTNSILDRMTENNRHVIIVWFR